MNSKIYQKDGRQAAHNVLMALEKGKLRDELLLYLGHIGINAYVSTQEKLIKKSLGELGFDCLIMQMNYRNFDALEILLYIRDKHQSIPVFILCGSNMDDYDFSWF